MSDLHPLRVSASEKHPLESVDPKFLSQGLLKARLKTIEVLQKIRPQIQEGITENEARKLALKIFSDHGVSKHWHRPYIRLGAGTQLTFHDPMQTEYRLQNGDPFYIDLGPVWGDAETGLEYEGDYGDTFVLGSNPAAEKCAQSARDLFEEARLLWNQKRVSGEAIYRFLKERAGKLNYELVEKVDGHRIGDFPHLKYSKERLAALQFSPSPDLWVLEVQLIDREFQCGAFFEDVLYA